MARLSGLAPHRADAIVAHMIRSLLFAILALSLAACAATPPPHPEARPFATAPTPATEVDAARARATTANKRVMLIFGLDNCHDSRALAGWFDTARFQMMLQPRYEIVWIDVGEARDKSADLAKRFQVGPIVGTPTVVIASADGTPLNLSDAASWRNAASRSENEIFDYFEKWGPQ